jgi:transposase InsO family protein
MARANQTWGEERLAAELLLKLGISVSPRTVSRYMKKPVPRGHGAQPQTWSTFLRNHTREVLASDFFVTVTAGFRLMYVFVVLDISTRRLVHWNVTEHPTAEWTAQQFRAFVTGDEPYRFVVHDRDAIFSGAVDRALKSMQLRVLTTPVRAPHATAYVERLIGTIRPECVDFLIPVAEQHLRRILAEWAPHDNQGHLHASLGPGIPDRPSSAAPR